MEFPEFFTFPCYHSNCDKVYLSKYSLRRHIKSFHLKIKPFVCPICSKAFIANPLLQEHLLVHTGEKPRQCTVCLKRFRHASQLSAHKKVHTLNDMSAGGSTALSLT